MPHRRDLFKLAALNAFAAAAVAGDRLPSATRGPAEANTTHEAFGDLRVYFDGPTEQLHAITAGSLRLHPGMSPHPPHQHPEEEIMVVAEGTGEISVEGKAAKVAPGSTMYCAAGKLHGIVNTGKSPLLFYYFKWKA
jgi:mannose-6-phosphate isomerase-like protein (cupin superfamily)